MTSNKEQQLTTLPALFIVGGTGRFVGKTTFAEMLIHHFAKNNSIVALKISNIKPGDDAVHGWHGDKLKEPFIIEEEKTQGDHKDTQRFLTAGAVRSFFMRSFEESLPEAMKAFFTTIDKNTLIVVESNTLRHHFQPSAFIMVTDESKPLDKPDAKHLLTKANHVLTRFDKAYFQELINQIGISNNEWKITAP